MGTIGKRRTMTLSFSGNDAVDVRRAIVRLGHAGAALSEQTLEREDKSNKQFGFKKEVFGFRGESFGFFGSSGSNRYQGAPVTSAADIVPKDTDYARAPFRFLSATIVAGGTWRATDFSRPGVLQASVPLMDGQAIYKEHETDMDNIVGKVEAPKWTESFTMTDGTFVPPGIDGIVAIDAITEAKTARNVLGGMINSDSVTVEFEWEPSHTFEGEDAEYMFECSVGKIIDGKMVCRVATKIVAFHELSLVWMGADPFAKAIKENGDLVRPDRSADYHANITQTEDDKLHYSKDKKYSLSCGLSLGVLSLAKTGTQQNESTPTNNTTMDFEALKAAYRKRMKLAADVDVTEAQILAAVEEVPADPAPAEGSEATPELANTAAEVLAEVTGEEVTPENVEEKLTALKGKGMKFAKAEDPTQVASLSKKVGEQAVEITTQAASIETLTSAKSTLEARVLELTPMATIGTNVLSARKAEAIRLYNISVENKASQAVLGIIEKAGPEELEGLIESYTKGVKESFSGKCADCGSSNFAFRSSVADPDPTHEEEAATEQPANKIDANSVSFESIRANVGGGIQTNKNIRTAAAQ